MSMERVETLIVGGGQAGLAMSAHLSDLDSQHLILERHRIAERWRSERWDSLVANGPAWHDRFPEMKFSGVNHDEFATKDQVVDYFEAFATQVAAPVRCGVEVTEVVQTADRTGFRAQTSDGLIEATNVVAATGPFQRPIIPDVVPEIAGITQIHSNAYRNSGQLPRGAVLVVGAGSSGAQIADELLRSGKRVYLAIGPHDRPPRRYRGRDFVWWLGVLGKWAMETPDPATEHVTIAVSGAYGGLTVDFRRLATQGMTLLGRAECFNAGVMSFSPDLADNLDEGDANYLSILDEADAYVSREGLDLPEEPDARTIVPDPPCVANPILELNLAESDVTSIVWATGYALDFSWLKTGVFDERGKPRHRRGVSDVPGLYFLGLPWLSNRSSSFIWGVWHDARYVAEHIARRRDSLAA